jgi:hypothetical protein
MDVHDPHTPELGRIATVLLRTLVDLLPRDGVCVRGSRANGESRWSGLLVIGRNAPPRAEQATVKGMLGFGVKRSAREAAG